MSSSDLSGCGYIIGGPFSWIGDWWAPALLDSAAADSDQGSVTPMRAYRAGPFRVERVAP